MAKAVVFIIENYKTMVLNWFEISCQNCLEKLARVRIVFTEPSRKKPARGLIQWEVRRSFLSQVRNFQPSIL